jgi:N-ethylmaleimide reductase
MYVPFPLLFCTCVPFTDWRLQVGRTTHPENLGGRTPLGPSTNTVPEGAVYFTPKGPLPFVEAREMTQQDIDDTISDYVHAAKSAIAAGFDGVEIHAANGYLPDQFICDNINFRTDKYGGSIENRGRFVIEVTDAVVAAVGADRVGIRFNPFGFFQGTQTSDIIMHYGYPISQINKRGLAYIHLVEPRSDLLTSEEEKMKKLEGVVKANGKANTVLSLRPFRDMASSTPFITCGSFDDTNAAEPVENGDADAVAIGRYFISNPDLPERLAKGYPLTKYDRNTFYTNGREGYTDYPFYNVQAKA